MASAWDLDDGDSRASVGSLASILAVGSIASIAAVGSIASIASIGSIASLGSVGSIASICSVGSVASIGGVGRFLHLPVAQWAADDIGRRLRHRWGQPDAALSHSPIRLPSVSST